jgi:hypothetical protein
MAGAKPQGNVGALRAAAGVHGPAGQGRAPLPSVDVDVSDFAEKPKDALGQVRDKMNLAADKKAGGVGFLRGLFSMFHTPKQTPDPSLALPQGRPGFVNGQRVPIQAPVQSKRSHGAFPLQRSEMDIKKSALSLTKKDLEDSELDKGLAAINHNRKMLSVKTGSPRRNKNKR